MGWNHPVATVRDPSKERNLLSTLVAINQTSIFGPRARRLTPTEAARLQGLPDHFSFASQPDSLSYKQVGNGVAVGAAWHVFRTHVERDQADFLPNSSHRYLKASLCPDFDVPESSPLFREARDTG